MNSRAVASEMHACTCVTSFQNVKTIMAKMTLKLTDNGGVKDLEKGMLTSQYSVLRMVILAVFENL